MEENSNSSSTNSHSDENKSPAGDPNALPFTKVEVEKIVKSNVFESKAAEPLTKTEQPNEVNLKVKLLYLYTTHEEKSNEISFSYLEPCEQSCC